MATLEIDPVLRKGFQLLNSKNRDSADQLKALVDEAHRQRFGKAKDPFSLRRESPIPRSKQASPSNVNLVKGSDTKRDHPHPKNRDDDVSHSLPKRPRLDSPHSVYKSLTPSPTPSIKSESSSKGRKSDESDSDTDMNDLAMEIGINCSVCKSFEQTSGNQLVECQECHSLYHQECHKPAVSHQDVTDPRLVWYCAKCSRTLRKRSTALIPSSSASVVGMRSASSPNTKNSSRRSPSKVTQRPSPFTNLTTVSGRSIGPSSTSASSSRNNSSSRNASAPPAANSIMNAERRVHLMKKKAAKNAERRKIM